MQIFKAGDIVEVTDTSSIAAFIGLRGKVEVVGTARIRVVFDKNNTISVGGSKISSFTFKKDCLIIIKPIHRHKLTTIFQ